jgi:hypothetical protein
MADSLSLGTSAPALSFHSTHFDIVDRDGQPWLRYLQIGDALGYKRPHLINKVYQAHAAEFTDSMTALVKLPTAGGEQEIRIFSLRGSHLLGMFARTAIAAEFRRWVLDVLEREGSSPALTAANITCAQAGELAALISERFPDGRQRPYAWGRFNNHFRVARYRELPAARFAEACSYIRQMPSREQPQLAAPAPRLPAPELPRLEFRPPPAAGSIKYDPNFKYPRYGRTIETTKAIVTDIACWANCLPPQARQDLQAATDAIQGLLVSGWTEVDEALGCLSTAMHYLNRWQGRGGHVGNVG